MAGALFNLAANLAGGLLGSSSGNYQAFLEDRAWTAQREDTAVQRRVEDMRKAGINPYTIGASSAGSTASTANSDSVQNRLQLLGSILDIGNLSLKNKKLANDKLSTFLNFLR